MPEKTPFRSPQFPCQRKFTSNNWRLEHVKLHHPGRLQVASEKNLSIHSAPRHVEPAQPYEFNANKDSVEDWDASPYHEHIDIIADSECQPPPRPQARTETYLGTGALLSDDIAEPWECTAQHCLEMHLQNNPYNPFAMCKECKYILCGIKKRGMKMYYDNVPKEDNTAPRFPSFNNGDSVQKLLASMPSNQALREWELHTLKDMRSNKNHQWPIIYWSRDVINSMRCLMRQPPYTEHLIYTPQRCLFSDTPQKRLCSEMSTADWWWETQVSRVTQG